MNGGGPPKGSPWDSPYAGPETVLGGNGTITPDPVAHPPPRDPLIGKGKGDTRLVYRQVPLVTVQHGWEIGQVREALRAHMMGQFELSAQLTDSILGSARVKATLGSRISGLFGEKVRFKPPNRSKDALDCLRAWKKAWPKLATAASMKGMHAYEILMGFEPAQLLWDTSQPVWQPSLEPWHPRYTYWDWGRNRLVAISQDGALPIYPGDGKWVLHAPWGMRTNERGWIHGATRSIAEAWLFRYWSRRDLARYSEVHGMPIRKAKVPAAAGEPERDAFAAQLSQLGQETTIMVQTGADGAGQDYDLELVEATDQSWESFIALRDDCDMEIVLAILFQNLTTEVTGGSFAATKSHMSIRAAGIRDDNEAWKLTIYEQIARPFAWLNFGDADLAPWTDWNVKPMADWEALCGMLSKFGSAIEVLRRGGIEFENPEDIRRLARRVGLSLPRLRIVEPVGGGGGGRPSEEKDDGEEEQQGNQAPSGKARRSAGARPRRAARRP